MYGDSALYHHCRFESHDQCWVWKQLSNRSLSCLLDVTTETKIAAVSRAGFDPSSKRCRTCKNLCKSFTPKLHCDFLSLHNRLGFARPHRRRRRQSNRWLVRCCFFFPHCSVSTLSTSLKSTGKIFSHWNLNWWGPKRGTRNLTLAQGKVTGRVWKMEEVCGSP
jgi:hypothetical protein